MYELFDVNNDPDQVNNLAYLSEYGSVVKDLEGRMESELMKMRDPRLSGNSGLFEGVRQQILERLQN